MPSCDFSRRSFLRTVGGAGVASQALRAATRRPNILLIMADDMGFSDIGCYGGEVATPNIDRLAKNGLRFTHFYNNAKCCPTRASLLTGLYNHAAGVGNMVDDMGLPAYQGYLNDRCVTIAEVLRQAGYTTLLSGKWHVGEERPHWPTDRGFDKYFGLISGSSSYFRISEERPLAIDDKPFRPKDDTFYLTDLFGDNAVKFLDEYGRKDKPFFLYTAFTSPHWPLHALPQDIAKYRGKYMMGWDELRKRRHARMIELGIVDKKWALSERDPAAPAWDSLTEAQKKDFDLKMAVYAAQIDRMDQNIGRILAKLKEVGAEENTLVLFLSDNGGCSVEVDRGKEGVSAGPADSFLSYGLPWANVSNTPFRRYKSWVHEGGISTPLIAYGPMVKGKGALTNQVGHLIDMMPTCVELSGAEYPKTFKGKPIQPMEGRSLIPILQGKQLPAHAPIYWEHIGNRAMRQGKWKLVSQTPKNEWELYDIEADRTELHDLAGKQPERVQEMSAMYSAWMKRCGVVPFEELKKKRKGKKA